MLVRAHLLINATTLALALEFINVPNPMTIGVAQTVKFGGAAPMVDVEVLMSLVGQASDEFELPLGTTQSG